MLGEVLALDPAQQLGGLPERGGDGDPRAAALAVVLQVERHVLDPAVQAADLVHGVPGLVLEAAGRVHLGLGSFGELGGLQQRELGLGAQGGLELGHGGHLVPAVLEAVHLGVEDGGEVGVVGQLPHGGRVQVLQVDGVAEVVPEVGHGVQEAAHAPVVAVLTRAT